MVAPIEKARPIVGDRWFEPFINVRRGICELLAHLTMLIAFLMTIRLLERVLQWLWGTNEKMLVRIIPVRQLFEAADLFLLVGFLGAGIIFVLKAYIRK